MFNSPHFADFLGARFTLNGTARPIDVVDVWPILVGARSDSPREYLSTTERLARKMHKHNPRYEVRHNPCIEPKKTRSELRKPMTVDTKYQMMHDLVVGEYMQEEVAQKYGRSQGYVSR